MQLSVQSYAWNAIPGIALDYIDGIDRNIETANLNTSRGINEKFLS